MKRDHRQKNVQSWLAAGIILFLANSSAGAVRESSQTLVTTRVVDTEWLAANLTSRNLRIVDLRDDIREYWSSHIPGAVFLDSGALRWPEKGVPSKLIAPQCLAALLGRMGISNGTFVVIYTEINNYRGTYLLWAMDYLGHRESAILMDGFEKWKKEGRPQTQDFPAVTPVDYKLPASLDSSVRATLGEVKNRDSSKTVLLDARPQDLFNGEKGTWKKKGHIQGAISHFWAADMNTDGSWRSLETLKKMYEAQGVTPDKTVIVSCGQGQMSSHTYFTLKYILGYPKVKNYDGSFNEWSNLDGLPVETGQQTPNSKEGQTGFSPGRK